MADETFAAFLNPNIFVLNVTCKSLCKSTEKGLLCSISIDRSACTCAEYKFQNKWEKVRNWYVDYFIRRTIGIFLCIDEESKNVEYLA